jgi:hypothetical protein
VEQYLRSEISTVEHRSLSGEDLERPEGLGSGGDD